MLELVTRFGLSKLASIIGVTAAVLVGLMLIIFNLASPPMALLYSSLEYADAGEIVTALDQQGIPYEVKGNGTMIFVPKDQVLKLRMDFASDGMGSGNVVGYEIFDNMDALGTTSFVQSINHLRALEGELARTISSLSGIHSTRVHLVIPERAVFGQDRPEPSASIMVRGRSSALTQKHVQAIQNLVASAVPNLQPGRVSIIDETGTLLTSTVNGDEQSQTLGAIDDRTHAFQERLRQQVQDIVERIVGKDRVRVQVAAELDFNRIVETSETYDPDSQVARSRQTIEESEQDSETESKNSVSIANNLPDQEQKEKTEGPSSVSAANRVEETINYEISHTQRTRTQEIGTVKRITVAVVIDGTYTENADGTKTYTPRSDAEIEKIKSLVKSAIGYSEQRGDTIEIANLQFAESPELKVEEIEVVEPLFGLTKNDYMRIGEIVAAIIVAIILMLVLRSVLSSSSGGGPSFFGGGSGQLTAEQHPQLAAPQQPGQTSQPGQPALPDQTAIAGAAPATALPSPAPKNDVAAQIDQAQIEGKIKESSIKKVGELVSAHPDESISIIRTWMQEA